MNVNSYDTQLWILYWISVVLIQGEVLKFSLAFKWWIHSLYSNLQVWLKGPSHTYFGWPK